MAYDNRKVNHGDFVFAAVSLEHGHIYGMTGALIKAGGVIKWVYDKDENKVAEFIKAFPDANPAESLEQILQDSYVHMVAAAAVPNERCALGIRVMENGKDYFTDKAPLTTLEQLSLAKQAVKKYNKHYFVYYSERLHTESAVLAGQLVSDGAIGDVVQVTNLAPHELSAPTRPEWFWSRERSGGILCDIGSHQIEQFLYYTKNTDASVLSATVANYTVKDKPEFNDYGSAHLLGANGATQFLRVDWLTPKGLDNWGDGRLFLLGTKGYIELRKNLDVARDASRDHLYIVDNQSQRHIEVRNTVGYPFFYDMITDCLNNTHYSMSQEHIFKAAELSITAQLKAEVNIEESKY